MRRIATTIVALLVTGCSSGRPEGKFVSTIDPNQLLEMRSDGSVLFQDSGSRRFTSFSGERPELYKGTYELHRKVITFTFPLGIMTVVKRGTFEDQDTIRVQMDQEGNPVDEAYVRLQRVAASPGQQPPQAAAAQPVRNDATCPDVAAMVEQLNRLKNERETLKFQLKLCRRDLKH